MCLQTALEKAQLGEGSLEELKETYRELRRKEERTLRGVREAEEEGKRVNAELDAQAEKLRGEREAMVERLSAADADRKALFREAQQVESSLRSEKARGVEAQTSVARYRELLKTQL